MCRKKKIPKFQKCAVFYIKAAVRRDPSHTAHWNTDISTGEHWQFQNLDSSECPGLWGGLHKILSLKNVARMKAQPMCWYPLFFSVTSSCTPPPCPRDDNFSDTLSQKADSEASSGHTGEDRCSGKDMASPTDTRISEAYITRSVHCDLEIIPFQQSITINLSKISSDWCGQKWYRKYLVVCYLLPIAFLVFFY